MRFLVNTSDRSKCGSACPITALIRGRSRNARSLFMTGAMACCRSPSLIESNHCQNGLKGNLVGQASDDTWSGSCSLLSSTGRAHSVMPGRPASVSSEACRMSCVRGPQLSAYSPWKTAST